MTRARKELISVETTPYYHCIVRCVRRAFLCGHDPYSGKNYDHRKQWVVVRLQQLASIFSIDVCAYAVMSNHYHVVLHVDQPKANRWSEREVAERWKQIFNGHPAVDAWLADDALDEAEQSIVDALLTTWRKRLSSISWFMRCMNETIARQSNEEDECKGRFWEGRFKSQPLLDEVALLACMTYVDLNPIRAGVAELPETSDFTSIQSRLHRYTQLNKANKSAIIKADQIKKRVSDQERALPEEQQNTLPQSNVPRAPIMPFNGCAHKTSDVVIPFEELDYFELVEMSGRAIRDDKKGFISDEMPSLIERFGIDSERWMHSIKRYGSMFTVAASCREKIDAFAKKNKRRWHKGVGCTDLVAHV